MLTCSKPVFEGGEVPPLISNGEPAIDDLAHRQVWVGWHDRRWRVEMRPNQIDEELYVCGREVFERELVKLICRAVRRARNGAFAPILPLRLRRSPLRLRRGGIARPVRVAEVRVEKVPTLVKVRGELVVESHVLEAWRIRTLGAIREEVGLSGYPTGPSLC